MLPGEMGKGGGRYRVQGETDGWHKGEASECVWLLLLLPQGRGRAEVVWGIAGKGIVGNGMGKLATGCAC